MTLYLYQLIRKRGSNNYWFDLELGAKFCHQTAILDKSVSLLKPLSLCTASETKHPPGKAL